MIDRRAAATCDTSVLLPALLAWQRHHEQARQHIIQRVRVLPSHVLLECFSVMTRLPSPHRISPAAASEALHAVPLEAVSLPPADHRELVAELARGGVRGGAVYDAAVAATARHHDLILITRDRRARATYDALGVRYELI